MPGMAKSDIAISSQMLVTLLATCWQYSGRKILRLADPPWLSTRANIRSSSAVFAELRGRSLGSLTAPFIEIVPKWDIISGRFLYAGSIHSKELTLPSSQFVPRA